MAAGICGAVGLGALYRGMAIGAMGVVAPISSVSAVIPFAVGIAQGERPAAVQLIGAVVALGGPGGHLADAGRHGGGVATGVGLALLAASRLRALLRLSRRRRRTTACRGASSPPG